jgi:hypothetical protein
MTIARVVRLAVACALGVVPARAGVLDSPPPAFPAGTGLVVYRISPVYYEPGRVDTVIACRNPTHQTVSAAVEVFDDDDRPRGGVARSAVSAGGDVLFVTSGDAGLDGTTAIPGLPSLPSGRARVSATSPELSCSATHRIRSADGGLKELPVQLVKRVASGAR